MGPGTHRVCGSPWPGLAMWLLYVRECEMDGGAGGVRVYGGGEGKRDVIDKDLRMRGRCKGAGM